MINNKVKISFILLCFLFVFGICIIYFVLHFKFEIQSELSIGIEASKKMGIISGNNQLNWIIIFSICSLVITCFLFIQINSLKKLHSLTSKTQISNPQPVNSIESIDSDQGNLITDKMVILGNLISGITHDIKTPIAIIKSSAETYLSIEKVLNTEIHTFFNNNKKDYLSFYILLSEHSKSTSLKIDNRGRRKLIRKIKQQLEHSIDSDALHHTAEQLININLIELNAELIEHLKDEKKRKILEYVNLYNSLHNNQSNIITASNFINQLIISLKTYIYKREDFAVDLDIKKTLQTIVTLFNNKIKTIEHEFQLEEVPTIKGYPDKIMQVWVNIIQNAIYELKELNERKPKLTISLSQNKTNIIVSITDNANGMTEEIKSKIFEHLYTTKPEGVGSGLGLHIVKNIIDQHQGSIEVISKLNEGSSFIIKFPINQNL